MFKFVWGFLKKTYLVVDQPSVLLISCQFYRIRNATDDDELGGVNIIK